MEPVRTASRKTSAAWFSSVPAVAFISSATLAGPILANLSRERRMGVVRSASPSRSRKSGEDHAVVDSDLEGIEPEGPEKIVNHQGGLDIGGGRTGPDRVEIALHELAVPAALRISPRQTEAMW